MSRICDSFVPPAADIRTVTGIIATIVTTGVTIPAGGSDLLPEDDILYALPKKDYGHPR
jgi:hypothetical protein